MTLENQLMLSINLVRVIGLSPNHLKTIILERERLFPGRKHLRLLPVFPVLDVPADSAQGQSMKLREMTNYPRAPSQTLQASVSMSRVKGHDTEPVWRFEGLKEKASL
ncbi:hypothetical protein CHARACLAT_026221 [Characodon lateralis]|uniref:Uncharacterized protein n=1 Tax=Characodon lateralis TaxID=208331 RepID=A0ABU7EXF8_9TELE|nr:hypothetical protein [Characodon lateralis]